MFLNGNRRPRCFSWLMAAMLLLALQPAAAAEDPFDQALHYYNAGQFAAAAVAFRRAYVAVPTNTAALYYEAECDYRLQNLAQARQLCRYIIAKYPTNTYALQARALLGRLPSEEQPAGKGLQTEARRAAQPVVVPFTFDNGILVQARINGRPVEMRFDTGADCMVRKAYLQQLGIDTSGCRAGGSVQSIGHDVSYETLDAVIDLGSIHRLVRLMVHQTPARSSGWYQERPLLGQTFFGGIPYRIDFAERTITFYPPEPSPEKVLGTVPYSWEHLRMIVPASVNGRQCRMLVDTGCQVTSFSDRQVAELGINRPTDAYHGVAGGVGGEHEVYAFPLQGLRVGPALQEEAFAQVATGSNMPYPLLGLSFLSKFTVTVLSNPQMLRFERQ